MDVDPADARYFLSITPTSTYASISVPKNVIMIFFVAVWLCFWVLGEKSVLLQLLTANNTRLAFLVFWLVGWTIAGIAAFIALIWQLVGYEIIGIEGGFLVYRAQMLGITKTWRYDIQNISYLRVSDFAPQPKMFRACNPPFFDGGQGPIVFDYGARTVRMGVTLEVAEARQLIKDLSSRLPSRVLEADP